MKAENFKRGLKRFMDKEEVKRLKVRVAAFKTSLQSISDSSKDKHVSVHIADGFNKLVESIGQQVQAIKPHLPSPISKRKFGSGEICNANYIDLEIYAEQLLGLIESVGET